MDAWLIYVGLTIWGVGWIGTFGTMVWMMFEGAEIGAFEIVFGVLFLPLLAAASFVVWPGYALGMFLGWALDKFS